MRLFWIIFHNADLGTLDVKLGVILCIFYNGKGGYFKKIIIDPMTIVGIMISFSQIKGKMFLIILRISRIYFFS
jgi:hypothetical protein